ncbi:MAG TPA: hypothetical protein VKP88_00300 [Candidatus Paceibacterota bacterium]|nr:hypothetical protein [Candidatus Paceibacterota bacterium]
MLIFVLISVGLLASTVIVVVWMAKAPRIEEEDEELHYRAPDCDVPLVQQRVAVKQPKLRQHYI